MIAATESEPAPPPRLRPMLPGALVGFALAATALPVGFVTGRGAFWDRPENDWNAYLVAWQYFLHDHWRFPLFDLPAMGYPEGGSALFNDALPLALLPSKILFTTLGVEVNPFGWWVLITYLLLGAFGARLIHAAGVRLPVAILVGSFLTVGKILFIWRLGHVAISSHFLIVWALTLYVEDVRDRRFAFPEHLVLAVSTLLINPYLVLMVAGIEAATVLTLAWRRQFTAKDADRAAIIVVAIVLVAWVEGYGAMFQPGPATMRAGGFGRFSWNLGTLLVPMNGLWGPSLVVRDATGGQYEGDGYLGGGVVLLALALLLLRPGRVLAALRDHWLLTLVVVACMAFAASNEIYLGSRHLASIPLPERVLDVASLFRASGRFIWVACYAITVFSVLAWVRWFPRSVAAVALAVAASVNTAEMRMAVPMVIATTTQHPLDVIDGDQITAWIAAHDRVFQFPSYSCGGLVPDSQWGGKDANRELRIQLIAARLGRPTNSVYTSRQLKDCGAQFTFAAAPTLEPGTFYMITKAAQWMTPAMIRLVTSRECLDAGYAYVCSRQPLAIESLARVDAQLQVRPSPAPVCPGTPPTMTVLWHTQVGAAAEVRIGTPDGTVAGSGPSGSAALSVPAGTNLYLMAQGRPGADPLDVESVYYSAGECAAGGEGRP